MLNSSAEAKTDTDPDTLNIDILLLLAVNVEDFMENVVVVKKIACVVLSSSTSFLRCRIC